MLYLSGAKLTRRLAFLFFLFSLPAFATCPAPIPGQPKVCLIISQSTSGGVTGYNVYRAATAGGENYGTPLNPTPITPASTMYYVDATVATGSTYFYTSVAIGQGGVLSPASPEASAQVPVPPNAPGLTLAID